MKYCFSKYKIYNGNLNIIIIINNKDNDNSIEIYSNLIFLKEDEIHNSVIIIINNNKDNDIIQNIQKAKAHTQKKLKILQTHRNCKESLLKFYFPKRRSDLQ